MATRSAARSPASADRADAIVVSAIIDFFTILVVRADAVRAAVVFPALSFILVGALCAGAVRAAAIALGADTLRADAIVAVPGGVFRLLDRPHLVRYGLPDVVDQGRHCSSADHPGQPERIHSRRARRAQHASSLWRLAS